LSGLRIRKRATPGISLCGRSGGIIAPDYSDFRAIRGLQIEGEARRLEDTGPARALMAARYSFLAQISAAPVALLKAWRKAAFYRLTPSRITLIDNTRGFGHKATLRVETEEVVSLESGSPLPQRICAPVLPGRPEC
jgi:hypothetical protein